MEYEAIVKISQHMAYVQPEPTVLNLKGVYIPNGDRHLVRYREFDPETSKPTEVVLDFGEEDIRIEKNGYVTTTLHIDNDGRHHKSSYRTEFGELPMEIESRSYEFMDISGLFILEMKYRLMMSSQMVGENSMKIMVLVKGLSNHHHDH